MQEYIRRFLYHQLNPNGGFSGSELPLELCPAFSDEEKSLTVYYSAAATYYAPSDPSGIGGMHREIVRAAPSWRGGDARFDCVFVNQQNERPGLLGMDVARVLVFLRIKHMGKFYPCAVVHWFHRSYDEPDEDTGMWIVRPAFTGIGRNRARIISIIHLETIVRAAHLIGVSLGADTPEDLQSSQALDTFASFYVNKYADHHAFQLLHQPYPAIQ